MRNKRGSTDFFSFLLYFIDIIIVNLSIYVSFIIKFGFNPPEFNFKPFLDMIPFISISYLIFMYVFGLNDILKNTAFEMIYSISLTVISLLITTSFISFFLRNFSYPRSVLLISTIIQLAFLSFWRIVAWKISRLKHGVKNCLIVGDLSIEDLLKKILCKYKDIYNIKFVCSSNSYNLFYFVDNVDIIFICSDVNAATKNKIIERTISLNKSIYIIPDMYDIALLNSRLTRVDDIPLLKVPRIGMTIEERFFKRVLDIVVSIIGIIVFSPIMIIMSITIKVTDKGNVLYKQERLTIDNKIFNVLKFRTMVMNAEKLTGPVLAGEEDPRITKVGKFMRATRIDEIPQFFNILLGDMSVVGPRPERPYFVEKYNKEIEEYKYRTLVKAGLTGLAQVLGKYNTEARDKLRYDLLYIKNYSMLLDLKVILQTIKIMFIKESSEGIKRDESLNNILQKYNKEITIDRD
ncbi:exopolysaccharide biosynthesis polyprenyl glycosylphosphotransferase [Clostridium amylolyticum]|uniref:Exopolysaccharide biosynthesis polyprenyl glycosylphosphotransferase n=1 Tax=Clostridium amylolyticum TaxID=1121298 RepID=A0A1M6KMA3_9CLOT|nr:sugar transferase [Clostridium amylolyticum]SHJ60026.1 exopolysaccharide biosynthesis polyprenyl glycosylphosphotransferase [Clostridium amylolyticum]